MTILQAPDCHLQASFGLAFHLIGIANFSVLKLSSASGTMDNRLRVELFFMHCKNLQFREIHIYAPLESRIALQADLNRLRRADKVKSPPAPLLTKGGFRRRSIRTGCTAASKIAARRGGYHPPESRAAFRSGRMISAPTGLCFSS